MRITKFEHACFVVDDGNRSIIVDPGSWTTNLEIPGNVAGVVITHEHADHLDKELLQKIVDKNPDTVVLAHENITSTLDGYKATPVVPNEGVKVGDFELEFFGGQHATIAEDMPVIANLGVLINGLLYYPGDSFSLPDDREIEILALPVAAPWMKYSEAAAFVSSVKPKKIFPTHDAILSQAGKDLIDSMAARAAEKVGAEYQRIDSVSLEA